MVILRDLNLDDAPLMLEWMHDNELVNNLNKNFGSMSIDDCKAFIKSAQVDQSFIGKVTSLHLAITDESNEYLGTVSLKDIDYENGTAEFGIVVRRCAVGKGIASEAMKQIISKGFKDIQLHQIYWCVDINNKRAIRFYEKNMYNRIDINDYDKLYNHIIKSGDYEQDKIDSFVWYLVEE